MPEDDSKLIQAIKLVFQEELSDVRNAVHQIDLKVTRIEGSTVPRLEFEKVVRDLERKRERTEEVLGNKIEALAEKQIASDLEQAKLVASFKVYLGIATFVAGVIGSVITALVLAAI